MNNACSREWRSSNPAKSRSVSTSPFITRKFSGQVVDHQRPHGAERQHRLQRVVDVHAPFRAVAEIGADQVGLMVDGEGDRVETGGGELPDHDLDNGKIAYRHERLWGDTV